MAADRLLVLLAAAGLLALAVAAARRWARRRLRRLAAAPLAATWRALEAAPDGRATVVAFSTPACAACHTAQLPALATLERRLGQQAVRVLRVDAAARPDLARTFGVLTVPSTVVLSPAGRVAAVNHGFTPAEHLARQLQTAG